ncbi:MAG: glyoxalase superfamily protein [Planctomycetota bacterium]
MPLHPPVPLLRIFDEAVARDFYVGFLGFSADWDHRHEAGLPIYIQVSRGRCTLHLTGHHGDCTPGAQVRIVTDDLDALHAELIAKNVSHNRPGIIEQPWGERTVTVHDPFGNRLSFVQPDGAP